MNKIGSMRKTAFFIFMMLVMLMQVQAQSEKSVAQLEGELRSAGPRERALIYQELFYRYQDINLIQAISYGDSSIHYARVIKDSALMHDVYASNGSYLIRIGKIERGYQQLFEALKYFSDKGSDKELSDVLNYIGLSTYFGGNYAQALSYLQRALDIRLKIQHERGIATSLNNVGLVYLALKDYPKAKDHFSSSYEKKIALGMNNSALRSKCNIGTVYFEEGKYREALKIHQEVLTASKNNGYPGGIALASIEIAKSYQKLGEYALAEKYFLEGKRGYLEIGDYNGVADALLYLARFYQSKSDFRIAKEELIAGISYAERAYARGKLAELLLELSSIQEQEGDLSGAYYSFKRFATVRDSLHTEEVLKKFAEIQVNVDLARRERQIEFLKKEGEIQGLQLEKYNYERLIYIIIAVIAALSGLIFYIRYTYVRRLKVSLEQKNSEIEKQKEALDESNIAKDRFFSILAHDLRSPFQATLGLSEVLAEDSDDLSKREISEYSREINRALRSQFRQLESVLTWSRLQLNRFEIRKEDTDIAKMIEDSVEVLRRNAEAKKITIRTEIRVQQMVNTDGQILTTVLHNLLGNAIKFSPEQTVVTIRASMEGDHLFLSVSDQGVGMLPDTVDKLFSLGENISTKGTANEKGTGLGLILCNEMVQKLGGNITVHSTVGSGSEFVVRIPTQMKN